MFGVEIAPAQIILLLYIFRFQTFNETLIMQPNKID